MKQRKEYTTMKRPRAQSLEQMAHGLENGWQTESILFWGQCSTGEQFLEKLTIKYFKSPGVLQNSLSATQEKLEERVTADRSLIVAGHPSEGAWCPNLKLLQGNYREAAMVLRSVKGMELEELQDLFHVVDEWLQGFFKTLLSVITHETSHTESEWHVHPCTQSLFMPSFQFCSSLLFNHILKIH